MAGLPTADDSDIATTGDSEAAHESGPVELETCPADSQDTSGSLECPICLQPCMHPVELPCRHVFCFLCIKGVAMQGPQSRCAICRATVPYSVLTNPQLKDISQLYKEPKLANGYQWYYESRSGGWWQYDERTMQDLERAFSQNQPTCQLLLAGHLYVVDFTQMIQYRSNNRSVSRRIRRGINLEKRGVAGIRLSGNNTGPGSSGGTNNSGSPPPPHSSGSSTRRRRGNTSTPNSVQQTASSASGHISSTGVSSSNPNLPLLSPQNDSDVASRGNEVLISDSDDESVYEDEDYDSCSEEDDGDDDMEIGEEEEALIGEDSDERDTEDEDEYDTRDGARAPTRRSDRSNSSNNQTPPPPSGTGISNGTSSARTYSPNSNGRASRGARSGRNSGGGRNGSSSNGTASRAVPTGLSETIPTSSSQLFASSNILAQLFFTGCNIEDFVSRNASNNNIYVDPHIIGQVNYGVSQTLTSITASTTNIKITFDRRSHLNQDEYL